MQLPLTNPHSLVGRIFFSFLVLKRAPDDDDVPDENSDYWIAECSCGKRGTMPSLAFRFGDIKSCGCGKPATEEMRSRGERMRRFIPKSPWSVLFGFVTQAEYDASVRSLEGVVKHRRKAARRLRKERVKAERLALLPIKSD